MRVLTVRRNHVAAAETPRPAAAMSTRPRSWWSTPLPSSNSQRASRASGSAASRASTKAASSSFGSWRYPSLHNRHIEERPGGRSSRLTALREDFIGDAFLILGGVETLGLQVEHGSIASAQSHQLL